MVEPGETFFPVQFGKTHPYFFDWDIMQGIGWTNFAAAHTEVAGCFFGIDLGCSCDKKIKSPPHFNTVKYTYLCALSALQTAG
jgi:hypothetical protein